MSAVKKVPRTVMAAPLLVVISFTHSRAHLERERDGRRNEMDGRHEASIHKQGQKGSRVKQ